MQRDRARRESEKMYLTGSPWRWCTVSCGYLSRWYGVRQWEGGRVTGPRRYRLALPHSNRWDYARCCRWSMMLWLAGRSSPRFVVDRGVGMVTMADGVSTERTEHFDRPCTHVRDCRTVPTEKGDQDKSTKRQKQAEHSRGEFFVSGIMREDEHSQSVIVKNTISA